MNATLATQEAPTTVKLVAVSGGLGAPSSTRLLSDRIVSHASRALEAHGIASDIIVIELRELAVPIANNLVTGYAEPALAAALDAVREADGLIVVTPVFNGSMAGLFKSFFDLLLPEDLQGTPVVLGATGGSARHSLVIDFALRPLFSYLRTLPVPTGIFAATSDWGRSAGDEASTDGIDARAGRVAYELADAVRLGIAGATPVASADGQEAPTIAATAGDFSVRTREENERRMQHEGFADLMAQFAGAAV